MRRTVRRATTALTVTLSCLGAVLLAPLPAGADPVEVQIVTINDFHGRLEPPSEGVGGAAQLAGLLTELRGDNPATSFVAAGDNIGASPFVSAIAGDEPTIEALDLMGMDASAVGNHEFDKGIDDLTDRVEPLADFAYLGANVYRDGTRALEAFEVVDVGGVDVGYIGVVTAETGTLVTPGGIVGVEFRDPVDEAEAVAAQLSDGDAGNGEADLVVVLAHEGAGPANIGSEAALAADPVFGDFVTMSADVDAIVSGHTHLPYAFDTAKPGGGTRPVVSAAEYGTKVGRITMTYDPDIDTVTASAVELVDVTGFTPDPDVEALVQAAVDESEVLGAEPLGTITDDILRGGTPPGADRGVESVMGNFVADVQLAGTQDENLGDADLALMNPGGLRADLLVAATAGRPGDAEGVVTYSEAFEVQPFANDVVTKTFTGAEIEQVLEEQWQPAGASRPVLWLGVSEGFTYEYTAGNPRGHRIDADSMELDGVPIDPDGEYRVTVNSFLASGGDNFTTLAGGDDPFTTGNNDLTMMVDYFEAAGTVTADTAPRTFAVPFDDPSFEPFESTGGAVVQQFEDIAGRTPTSTQSHAWEVAIFEGRRTLGQLVVELQQLDLRSSDAAVQRLYLGFFGRAPSAADLEYWTAQLDGAWTINGVAQFFARSAETQATYGSLDDAEFVTLVYENVLGRTPSDADQAYWEARLAAGLTRGKLFLHFSESAENRFLTAAAIRGRDIIERMIGELPTGPALNAITGLLTTGELGLVEMVEMMRLSDEYAERLGLGPGPT